jgi:poly(ADP-ribose) glycohydrolase ARH3
MRDWRRREVVIDGEVLRDKFRGTLIGAVVGDCLGAPFVGHPGPVPSTDIERVAHAFGPLSYTDDTAMTAALAESLLFRGVLDEDHLAATFAVSFERQPHRGYSSQTAALLGHIAAGGSWRTAAQAQFAGQGSWPGPGARSRSRAGSSASTRLQPGLCA